MNRVVRNSAEFGTASMGKCVAIIVRRRGSGATMHRGSRGVFCWDQGVATVLVVRERHQCSVSHGIA